MAYNEDGWQPAASSRGGPALSIYTSRDDATAAILANGYWRVVGTDYRLVKETIVRQAADQNADRSSCEIPVLIMGNNGLFALAGMRVAQSGANAGQITITNRKGLV